MLVWLYGLKGNRIYLSFALSLRTVTRLIPNRLLTALSYCAISFLRLYALPFRLFPVPMSAYFNNQIRKLTNLQLMATVFDPLNPAYAKYYT